MVYVYLSSDGGMSTSESTVTSDIGIRNLCSNIVRLTVRETAKVSMKLNLGTFRETEAALDGLTLI